MAKVKTRAIVMMADAAGGMAQVHDRRFEATNWPIRFDVPRDQADLWFQYLSAECGRRGWSSGGISQLEARENSGSITIMTGGTGQPQLSVVWNRKPNGPIRVRAQPTGTPELPLDQANDFLRLVNERSSARVMEQFHRGSHLSYEGLPWRGELWLEDKLRLGPPSQQDELAMFGPRIILVDALVDAIDGFHAVSTLDLTLRELAAFLTVVIGTNVSVPPNVGRVWTWNTTPEGEVECGTRNLGYFEKDPPKEMPAKGQIQAIPLKPVSRPDFSRDGTKSELHLPEDILELWRAFTGLAPDRRRQFLQVANMWQLALSLSHDYETARFAWMVAACEVLKPPDAQYRDHNIYHVVEALLGKTVADKLHEQWFRPQDIRNALLHRGEFRGSEFLEHTMTSSFQDPTFRQANRELYQITQAAIIEWLRQAGIFTMPPLKRRKGLRRWIRNHALSILPIAAGVGIVVGVVLAWVLRTLWPS